MSHVQKNPPTGVQVGRGGSATDPADLCRCCRRSHGRAYQVYWGTAFHNPLRDDQESGGRAVIQFGYRVEGSVAVPLCPQCAHARFRTAAAHWAIKTTLFAWSIGLWGMWFLWFRPTVPPLVPALVMLAVAVLIGAARRSGLIVAHPPDRPIAPEYLARELALEDGLIPGANTPFTRFELEKLGPPDADGVRWERV